MPRPGPGLRAAVRGLACLTVAATLLLIVAGGIVTNTGNALAVPDWPTTFGHGMFRFPWSGMVGGILIEHGHRLLGALVGLLTVTLAGGLWLVEARPAVRRLGGAAVGLVVVQGLVGGLRVVLRQDGLAIVHGAIAQAFFAVTVVLAVVSGRAVSARTAAGARATPDVIRRTRLVVAALYGQIVLGALTAHAGWVWAHVGGAVVATGLVVTTAAHVLGRPGGDPVLGRWAGALGLLAVAQLGLGTGAYLARLDPALPGGVLVRVGLPVAHRALGAVLLGAAVAFALHAGGHAMGVGGRQRLADRLSLAKPRVVLMVVLTAWVGYHLGARGEVDGWRLGLTLLGVALAAGGTLALNQYLERDLDGLMVRTRQRPLPSGRLPPGEVAGLGLGGVVAGIACQGALVGWEPAVVTALTALLYLGVYTPLKRVTWLATMLGAVPGALPPVTGWVAVRGELGAGAALLFAIVFLWQLPHTLAIGRLHRADYARAGIRVLPVVDPDGRRTARHILAGCALLLLTTLLPGALGLAGPRYLLGALGLGLALLAFGAAEARAPSPATARRLLLASVVYLPALLGLMAVDRLD